MTLIIEHISIESITHLTEVPEGWHVLAAVNLYSRVVDFLIHTGTAGYLVGKLSVSEALYWAGGEDFVLAQIEEELREVFRWN